MSLQNRLEGSGRRFREMLRLNRDLLGEIGNRIANPRRLQRKLESATALGKWLAAFFLIFIVTASFAYIVAINEILADLLDVQTDAFGDVAAWLVTAITLAMLIFAAWFWFQWVRTAGLGMFNWL